MTIVRLSIRLACLATALFIATAPLYAERKGPPHGNDVPLPAASPHEVGIDAAALEEMSRRIAAERKHKLHSLLVLRHGKLVFEAYYGGYARDRTHDIRSATKSVTSLLTGMAIEAGAIEGVDAPLMRHMAASYPEITDKNDILVEHLLTMRSGLDCDDRDRKTRGQEDRMYRSRDWIDYFLSLETVHPPGEVSRYCTGGVVALGEAIAQATGEDFATFARRLFDALGIENLRWARFDRDRKVDSGGHLEITPQGMAKIGQLILQSGKWHGQQIVPTEWIQKSITFHTELDGNAYGFLWWLNAAQYGAKKVRVISARGNGGQAIFIVPELDMVVVSTAGYYNSEKAGMPHQLFYNAILPAVDEIRAAIASATPTK